MIPIDDDNDHEEGGIMMIMKRPWKVVLMTMKVERSSVGEDNKRC